MIREAGAGDIEAVKRIADSYFVREDEHDKKCGFYRYSLSKEQFQRRLNPLFLVSELHGIDGYILAYNDEFAERLLEVEPELSGDPICQYMRSLEHGFVYVDMIAVRRPGTSPTRSLRSEFFKRCAQEGSRIIAAIPMQPWKNAVSLSIAEKLDFKLLEKVQTYGMVFGVYCNDPGFSPRRSKIFSPHPKQELLPF